MKARVIEENEDKGREFKVRRMNYNEVIINYPTGTGLKTYKYNEVKLISEGEVDDFLIDNREFLKIKLNRGISIFFYQALKNSFEEELNDELKNFSLLRDKYKVNKRGIWDKEIVCIVNNTVPIQVIASGQNFKREGYSISINRIPINDFLDSSIEEINKIQKEIRRKELLLSIYGEAINNIKESKENKENKEAKLLT